MSAKIQRPASNDDRAAWQAYWKAQGMPWRTEPEIGAERQQYLGERRTVKPDIENGIYPFRDENGGITLNRADVEWLLATHESGGVRGPVDWSDEKQHARAGIDLRGATLCDIDLSGLPLANLHGAFPLQVAHATTRQQRRMSSIHLERVNLQDAHLEGAEVNSASLQQADLRSAHLERAVLYSAHLEGTNLNYAHLEGADLRRVFLDEGVYLYKAVLCSATNGSISVVDARWNGASLGGAILRDLHVLGDEEYARYRYSRDNDRENAQGRLDAITNAVQANRQFSLTLRSQGLNEYADRFAYRAQLLQRTVSRRQKQWGRALGSWLLDFISGYGYKPMRSVITYLVVILCFAAAYFALTNFALTPFLPSHSSPLAWYEAIVLSISSFHGRGLFPSGLSLGDPVAILAAFEAIIGFLIEITFIATFTQRFFAR
jgi:uncharacterized protein YjbI with pentapeptide repeats